MPKPKTIKAGTILEVLAKIYKAEGWTRVRGESRTKRAGEVYDICVNWKTRQWIATRKGD